jgi:hypothetical protein
MNSAEREKYEKHVDNLTFTASMLRLRAATARREGQLGAAAQLERDADSVSSDIPRVLNILYSDVEKPQPQPHPSSCLGGMRHAEPATKAPRLG